MEKSDDKGSEVSTGVPATIGILGGTGPAGRGLAIRLAAAGIDVWIGSRDEVRAGSVADEIMGRPELADVLLGKLCGATNETAAAQELVVVATPWDSASATVRSLKDHLHDKVLISMANALVREGKEMLPIFPARGSVAAAIQKAAPGALVAAAFHHLPASEMENLDSGLTADVLLCSDHPKATAQTMALVAAIDGLRPIDAGSLAQATAIEAFTAVCISVNIRHKVHSAVQLTGI